MGRVRFAAGRVRDARAYANYAAGVAASRVRIYGAPPRTPSLPPGAPNFARMNAVWRAEWASSPALQRDHATTETYANWKKGVATGRARIIGRTL